MNEWIAFTVLALVLIGVAYVAWHIRHVRRRIEALHRVSDGGAAAEAMGEARSAHDRIDRLDDDSKTDRHEMGALRAFINTIHGRVKWLQHKDIREELGKHRDEGNRGDDGI